MQLSAPNAAKYKVCMTNGWVKEERRVSPTRDEVGGPQETLKELTFEWSPEIWEKEEKLCWEQWD